MPGTSAKRVVLYRFDRQPTEGFLSATRFQVTDLLEIITLEGNLQVLTYLEVKAMCFVSGSGPFDLFEEHTSFERRPKIPGLWTRFAFRDGDFLDGVLPHNLAEWPEAGFLATPPRSGSLRQRVFLPRLALTRTELLGIIGKPHSVQARSSTAREQPGEDQLSMFE